jgi:hypothetical protein
VCTVELESRVAVRRLLGVGCLHPARLSYLLPHDTQLWVAIICRCNIHKSVTPSLTFIVDQLVSTISHTGYSFTPGPSHCDRQWRLALNRSILSKMNVSSESKEDIAVKESTLLFFWRNRGTVLGITTSINTGLRNSTYRYPFIWTSARRTRLGPLRTSTSLLFPVPIFYLLSIVSNFLTFYDERRTTARSRLGLWERDWLWTKNAPD